MIELLAENFRENLKVRGHDQLGVKVAVVLTKADALGPAGLEHPYQGPAPAGATGASTRAERDLLVRAWIEEVGVRPDVVASVLTSFKTSSFFVVSHADAVRPDRDTVPMLNDDPSAPVQWLLGGGVLA